MAVEDGGVEGTEEGKGGNKGGKGEGESGVVCGRMNRRTVNVRGLVKG